MRLRSGDKHHLRKSADGKAQIRKAFVPLCFSICWFSQVVFIPRAQPHAQSLSPFPIVFGINLTSLLPPLSSRSGYTFRKLSYRFPTVSRTSTLNSFNLPRAVALWNVLPTNVQQASTIYAFKKILQSHLNPIPTRGGAHCAPPRYTSSNISGTPWAMDLKLSDNLNELNWKIKIYFSTASAHPWLP